MFGSRIERHSKWVRFLTEAAKCLVTSITDVANVQGVEQGKGSRGWERENSITALNGFMERAFHLEAGFCLMPLCSNWIFLDYLGLFVFINHRAKHAQSCLHHPCHQLSPPHKNHVTNSPHDPECHGVSPPLGKCSFGGINLFLLPLGPLYKLRPKYRSHGLL